MALHLTVGRLRRPPAGEACKMDVNGVTVQWMCQKLNPANIALLAGTEECEALHEWRSM